MSLITSKKLTAAVLAVTLAMSLSACSNMSKRDRNTAIGAGAGALGGAVLTDGSALGTLGGAAVGGIIGHQADAQRRRLGCAPDADAQRAHCHPA
jgi:osmotically inducible lipoprotein OsmB